MHDPITQATIDAQEVAANHSASMQTAVKDALKKHAPEELAAAHLQQAIQRLDHLAAKEDGWKGKDSIRMPQSVREAAEAFLRANSEILIIGPFIGLDADGDVTVFIKNEQITMDLSIGSDHLYSYYAKVADGGEFSAEDIPVTQRLPDAVLKAG